MKQVGKKAKAFFAPTAWLISVAGVEPLHAVDKRHIMRHRCLELWQAVIRIASVLGMAACSLSAWTTGPSGSPTPDQLRQGQDAPALRLQARRIASNL